MNFKTYTSKAIDPSVSSSILLDDICLEEDQRSIVVGLVIKEDDKGNTSTASNALVSLYQGLSSAKSYPKYHTYTDENGRFLFPINDINETYQIKALYSRVDAKETYKPYLSKPFKVEKGEFKKIICLVELENRRIISGTLSSILHQPLRSKTVNLYITIGPDKIPIIQMASTKTDSAGRFDFSISAEGNYCINIII